MYSAVRNLFKKMMKKKTSANKSSSRAGVLPLRYEEERMRARSRFLNAMGCAPFPGPVFIGTGNF